MRSTMRLQPTTTQLTRGSERRSEKESSALVELAGRFARFRRERGRGARVPFELRAAALAALESGVKRGELNRACGVSWSQLMTWKANGGGATKPMGAAGDVRAFSVIDEPVAGGTTAVANDQVLELRLGPWSVSVRLSHSEPVERG